MVKLNNIVIFACNEGGHFAQLMALKELFSKYDSVILTDNKRANKGIPSLKDVKAIEFAMAFADKRDELTKDKDRKLTHASYLSAYWKLFKQCHAIWKKYRPKAKFHGSHFVYIETRAKVYNKTISGKIVERFADKVIVQWPEMVDVYKGHAEYYGTLV